MEGWRDVLTGFCIAIPITTLVLFTLLGAPGKSAADDLTIEECVERQASVLDAARRVSKKCETT